MAYWQPRGGGCSGGGGGFSVDVVVFVCVHTRGVCAYVEVGFFKFIAVCISLLLLLVVLVLRCVGPVASTDAVVHVRLPTFRNLFPGDWLGIDQHRHVAAGAGWAWEVLWDGVSGAEFGA